MSQIDAPQARSASDVATEEISALLARRRLPDHALCPLLGVSNQAISKRMRGVTPWTLADLDVIAGYFGVDANTLLPTLGNVMGRENAATEAYCAPAGQPRLRLVASNSHRGSEVPVDRELRVCPEAVIHEGIARAAQATHAVR